MTTARVRVMTIGAIAVATCLGPANARAEETQWVSYLRAGPGPKYNVLQELPAQLPIDVLGCESGWCRVQSGRYVGYVQGDLVGAAPGPQVATSGADCFEAVLSGHVGGSHVRICKR